MELKTQATNYTNTIKGLSIISIVAFHVCGQIFHGEPKWFRTFTYQGVHAFFLVSGMGLSLSMLSKNQALWTSSEWLRWFKKRVLKTLPLYWLVLTITFFAYILDFKILKVATSPQLAVAIIDFAKHFFLLHIYFPNSYYSINVAWWFLAVIFHFYLLYPLIIKFFRNTPLRIVLFVCACLAYTFNKRNQIIPNQITLSFMFFLLGIFFAHLRNFKINKLLHNHFILISLTLSCLTFFSIGSLYGFFPALFRRYNYEVASLCTTLLLCILPTRFPETNPNPRNIFTRSLQIVLDQCGKLAYAIFLIHWGLIYSIVSIPKNKALGIFTYLVFIYILSLVFTNTNRKIAGFGAS